MTDQQQSKPHAWGDDVRFEDSLDLQPTAVVVRQEAPKPVARSEYADLAELARMGGARDTRAVLAEARRVGALLGERAYYDFPAGQGRVTGPTIDLMDALAIVWGRLVSTVSILEETATRVHLRGRVVDLLALTAVERDYVSGLTPAPGRFAAKAEQADRWKVMQLQAASSKAIRGALEHALPVWLVDAALESAREAVAGYGTGGLPLPEARMAAVDALWQSHGLDRAALEAWLETPADLWAGAELARLRKLAGALKRGEVAAEAIRAEAQLRSVAAPAAQPAGDRMADLGLRRPAPVASPSPAPSSAAPASSKPAKPAHDPEKEALIAEIQRLHDDDRTNASAVFEKMGLLRIGDLRKRGVVGLTEMLGELRARIAAAEQPDEPAVDFPATREQLERLSSELIELGDEVVRPVAERHGVNLDSDSHPGSRQVAAVLADLVAVRRV